MAEWCEAGACPICLIAQRGTDKAKLDKLSEQADILYRDVNDMMNALRLVASADTPIDTVRDIAKRALAELRHRGVGDGADASPGKAE